jgi:XRE family aerobic/anaerobic benzoate catabolism transcriptional regulator
MTRKSLAKDSGVSERYLALLESGSGNGSVLLLRQVARALDVPLGRLLADGPDESIAFTDAVEFLRRLSDEQLRGAYGTLVATFGAVDRQTRAGRIALIGLRGAGKSTLGARLARALGVKFIELDREIERDRGLSLGAIFDLYGQAGFRRFERQSLDRILATRERFVLATGGGIVAEPATFQQLRTACFTVWLRATPKEHMERVIAQGDMRPMGGDSAAMADLRRILATREGLYQEADLVFDSSGRSVAESAKLLARKVVSETSGERPPSRIRRAKTAAVRKRPRQKVGSPG